MSRSPFAFSLALLAAVVLVFAVPYSACADMILPGGNGDAEAAPDGEVDIPEEAGAATDDPVEHGRVGYAITTAEFIGGAIMLGIILGGAIFIGLKAADNDLH
jgi:hypothetical protein